VRLALDPWIITDDEARTRFERDPEAVAALVNTWRNDPDHAQTRQIQDSIKAALDRGTLTRQAYYFCCPWSPVYAVQHEVTIDGKRLRLGQQFTFDVSAEDVAKGGRFRREILLGDFQATEEVDYCLPDAK